MQEYDNVVSAAIAWEPKAPSTRFPDVPFHFPLAIQNTWVPPRPLSTSPDPAKPPSTTSSSSSSSSRSSSAGGKAAEAQGSGGRAVGGEGAVVLTEEDAKAVAAVGRAMKSALGVELPERGRRGTRGLVVATLNPVAVQGRLRAWVDVCGLEYVRQVGGV